MRTFVRIILQSHPKVRGIALVPSISVPQIWRIFLEHKRTGQLLNRGPGYLVEDWNRMDTKMMTD
jgi:hypothetical protein